MCAAAKQTPLVSALMVALICLNEE